MDYSKIDKAYNILLEMQRARLGEQDDVVDALQVALSILQKVKSGELVDKNGRCKLHSEAMKQSIKYGLDLEDELKVLKGELELCRDANVQKKKELIALKKLYDEVYDIIEGRKHKNARHCPRYHR